MVIVVPYPLPHFETLGVPQSSEYYQSLMATYGNLGKAALVFPDWIVEVPAVSDSAHALSGEDAFVMKQTNVSGTDWIGEVVDLGLDGRVTVRLGLADEIRDIRLPLERLLLVASSDDEGPDSELEDTDDDSDRDSTIGDNVSELLISLDIQYSGGHRLDSDSGDDMWSTDDDQEAPDLISLPATCEDRTQSPSVRETTLNVAPQSSSGNERLRPSSGKECEMVIDHSKDGDQRKVLHACPLFARCTRLAEEAQQEQVQHSDQADEDTMISLESPTATTPESTNMEDAGPQALPVPSQFLSLQEPCPSDHHFFSKRLSMTGAAMRRVLKEHRMLQTALPEGVFIRTWEDRLDLLRVLIVGPRATPYEMAPFLIDFHFGDTFPMDPPEVYFHSWTNGIGRVNPNLYEDGKICLSILGTWPGDNGNETWSAQKSTVLQVVVSIMGLVLVKDPFHSKSTFAHSDLVLICTYDDLSAFGSSVASAANDVNSQLPILFYLNSILPAFTFAPISSAKDIC